DPGVQAREQEHRDGDERDAAQRPQGGGERAGARGGAQRRERGDERVVTGVGGHADGGRHLLEEDDARDPEREALDDGPRDVRDDAAEARDARDEHDDAREHGDERDGARPVRRDDRREHHGHRARGSRDLVVRPAEHGGDDSRDDGGDETGGGADPGADAERERERERDDADRDAREEVGAQGAGVQVVVGAAGEQVAQGRGAGAHARAGAVASSTARADAPGSAGSRRAASSRSDAPARLDRRNARATTSSSATRGSARRYSTALPRRVEVRTPARRSRARCWESGEGSEPVTARRGDTGAVWSASAARASSTWMRVGCARQRKRSALMR